MKCAPIIIPTLCRHKHFIRCVESLKRNSWAKYTDLFIGLDYPPSDMYIEGYKKIEKYLEESDFSVFSSVHIIKRKENYGSSRNGTDLRELVLSRYDCFIRTDDDIEFAPNFLEYMNKCLEAYKDDPSIIAVTGYSYPIDWEVSEGATVFKQNFNAATWGIGFWKEKYLQISNEICHGKHFDDFVKFVSQRMYRNMLDAALVEYVPNSVFNPTQRNTLMTRVTDIALRAYMGVEDKYVISPVISKSRNYGFDGSGEYCQNLLKVRIGKYADNYDYTNQFIDTDNKFHIIEDTLESTSVNLQRLNDFDRRQKKQKLISKSLICLASVVGVANIRTFGRIISSFRKWYKQNVKR